MAVVRGVVTLNKNINAEAYMNRELDSVHILPKLHQAVCDNDILLVSTLLEDKDYDINQCTEMGESALYYATYFGYIDIVHLLLNGPNPAQISKDLICESELHAAARGGHLDCARACLDAGSYINAQSLEDRWTPLHIACFRKDYDMIELFIQYKANVNMTATLGYMPINLIFVKFDAQQYRMTRCFDIDSMYACLQVLLTDEHADVNHWSFTHGRPGPFLAANPLPLERACGLIAPDIVRLLLNNGAHADGVYSQSCFRVPMFSLFHLVENVLTRKLNSADQIHRLQRCVDLLVQHGIKQDVQTVYMRGEEIRNRTVGSTRLRTISNIYSVFGNTDISTLVEKVHPAWIKFLNYLKERKSNPLTLKMLTRESIRRSLSHKISFKTRQLPLPDILKKFVLLEDI